MFNPTIKLIKGLDLTGQMMDRAKQLTVKEVLVGVPRATNSRNSADVNNAMLAYIHDNGSPIRGIPPREFLRPGIKDSQSQIVQKFEQIGRAVLNDGDAAAVDKGLTQVGLIAQKSVRRKITVGPFKPLKPATLRARRRRGRSGSRPLIDTGALRASISFQVVNK